VKLISKSAFYLLCFVAVVVSLVAADAVFAVTWDLATGLFLTAIPVACGAIPLSALFCAGFGIKDVSRFKSLLFIVAWTAGVVFFMSTIRGLRVQMGSSVYLNRPGNCSTLFFPAVESERVQSWLKRKRPTVQYVYAVSEDVCRVVEMNAFCSKADGSDCFRDQLKSVTSHAPLTMPGVALGLLEGASLSMHESEGKKPLDELKLAADSFGVAEEIVKAARAHFTPVPFSGKDTDWEMIKTLYRRNGLSRESEAGILNLIDQKLEAEITREVLVSVKRIDERIARVEKQLKPTDTSPALDSYRARIQESDGFFRTVTPPAGDPQMGHKN
jgi:hypothetical protein